MMLAEADRTLSFGDYAEAASLYRQASLGPSASDTIKAASLYGLGLTYYKQNDLFQAKKAFDELTSQYPDSLPAKRANFVLAQISLDQELEEDALDYFKLILTFGLAFWTLMSICALAIC